MGAYFQHIKSDLDCDPEFRENMVQSAYVPCKFTFYKLDHASKKPQSRSGVTGLVSMFHFGLFGSVFKNSGFGAK